MASLHCCTRSRSIPPSAACWRSELVDQPMIEVTPATILAHVDVVVGRRGRAGRGPGNVQRPIHVEGNRLAVVVHRGIDFVPRVIGHRHTGGDRRTVGPQILQRQFLVGSLVERQRPFIVGSLLDQTRVGPHVGLRLDPQRNGLLRPSVQAAAVRHLDEVGSPIQAGRPANLPRSRRTPIQRRGVVAVAVESFADSVVPFGRCQTPS